MLNETSANPAAARVGFNPDAELPSLRYLGMVWSKPKRSDGAPGSIYSDKHWRWVFLPFQPLLLFSLLKRFHVLMS